ncbi:fibroin heavy chain-like [Sparus aurata]|uniref:Fibroin heavy chain-like n=1 Tax=Sparus aurata TaxID=8175 RepID=A0A671U934_SPAAU|nr:fibroin heavy chain-like [Sparus aurata]XP_030278614.1 fibroin heavy chain-like [Sparus aurata]
MSSKEAAQRVGRDICVSDPEYIKFVKNIDRPGNAIAAGTYAGTGAFDELTKDAKAGAYAAAGVGYSHAEWSVFEAEAKGPNASAGAGLSLGSGAQAMARAEVASASASAGPLEAKVGLGVDTGVSVGPRGLEAKVLGTGVTIGPTTSISLLGNELSFKLW